MTIYLGVPSGLGLGLGIGIGLGLDPNFNPNQVRTSHFLVLDVDIWPSASLATIIANLAPVAMLKRKLAALVA